MHPLIQEATIFCRIFKTTRALLGRRLYVIIAMNLFGAFSETFGLLLFIPLFTQLGGVATVNPSTAPFVSALFLQLGLENTLRNTLALVVLAFTAKSVALFAIYSYQRLLLARLRHELRDSLIRATADLDFRIAGQLTNGMLGTLVVKDTDYAVISLDFYSRCLTSFITMSIFLLSAMNLDPILGLLMLLVSGVYFLIVRRFTEAASRYSRVERQIGVALNEFLSEAYTAFRFLKSTALFPTLLDRLLQTTARHRLIQNQLSFAFAATHTLREPLLLVGVICLIYVQVGLRGGDVATLAASLMLFYRAMSETNALGNHWFTVSETSSGLNSALENLESFRKHREQDGTISIAPRAPEICFDNVSFSYSDIPVLSDVSFTLPAGSTSAFIGRSGAGKSTLVNLLTGLLKPQAGEISINGIPLQQIKADSYRSQIGYVTQDAVLFNASVASNITLRFVGEYSEVELAELERVCRLSHCWDFIQIFPDGLATVIGESGSSLSGGQRQRIALARELYRRPKLLILDESTSSLDIISENAVFENIRSLHGELTLIVISHRSSAVEGVENLFLIEDNSIISCADPNDTESYQNTFLRAFRANQRR